MRTVFVSLLFLALLVSAPGCGRQDTATAPNPSVSNNSKDATPPTATPEAIALPPGVTRISVEEAFAKVKELGGEVIEQKPMGKPLKDLVRFDRAKIHGKDLTFLYSIPWLHSVSFIQSDVQDEDLKQLRDLPEVTTVSLNYTGVTDACLPHLEAMPKLFWVTFADTKISAENGGPFRKRIEKRRKKPR